MYNSVLIFSAISFIILIIHARWYKININIDDFLIYSFLTALVIISSVSMIVYAASDKLIFELSDFQLRIGILMSGAIILKEGLKSLYNKIKPIKKEDVKIND